jgi:flagellar protein FliL
MAVMTAPPEVATGDAAEAKPKKSKKKLLIGLVLLLVIGGAGYWFVLKPKPAHPAPQPGAVVALEPIQVNLQGGHYLKIGIALQLTSSTKEADGSKALDATIELFSGRSMDELTRTRSRETLKEELVKRLEKLYEDEVMDVYFTDLVTQ